MKVRALHRMTVDGRRVAVGETVELPTAEAKELIEAKYAGRCDRCA